MGISRKEYWIVLPCPPPGDLPNPGIKPYVLSLMFPALARGFFTTSTTWQVPFYWSLMQNGNNWLGNKLLAEVNCSNSLTIPDVFMTLIYKTIILMAQNFIAILWRHDSAFQNRNFRTIYKLSKCSAWSLSLVWLFATPRTEAHQAPLSMRILQASILK